MSNEYEEMLIEVNRYVMTKKRLWGKLVTDY